ncbi:metallothiol transferase [Salirhabdus euzebyi]|uniref:Metallothiol transferase n=1 Tax=Salirhabdus euzebyi TaxID=394506 RepID=A0A841Q8N4_9BACI|nr:VOC family protein [Salirhabdus euzebyi]MBB6454637.1 metallothiol transferase [Salirhabdus euzebyi]
MKVTGFNHITLNVSDLKQSLEFYLGILGIELVHKGRMDAYLEWGSVWICLQERKDYPNYGVPQIGVDHIAFSIEEINFHHAVEHLKKNNVPIVREPFEKGKGWVVNFLDPDGIQLELHTSNLSERMTVWK